MTFQAVASQVWRLRARRARELSDQALKSSDRLRLLRVAARFDAQAHVDTSSLATSGGSTRQLEKL